MTDIRKILFELQDTGYRSFHKTLIPTVPEDTIIGVRVPRLRRFAKDLYKKGEHTAFLDSLPHRYYEENMLHALLLNGLSDFDECLDRVESFLPYVDNWAVCDSLRPKAFKKDLDALLEKIKAWISTDKPYTVRFAIEMLMCFYLDGNFKTEYADLVAGVKSEHYYVNMMVAWYFATALAKQYDKILPYIENKSLPAGAHNKAIRKAVESFRITKEQKEKLKTKKL